MSQRPPVRTLRSILSDLGDPEALFAERRRVPGFESIEDLDTEGVFFAAPSPFVGDDIEQERLDDLAYKLGTFCDQERIDRAMVDAIMIGPVRGGVYGIGIIVEPHG